MFPARQRMETSMKLKIYMSTFTQRHRRRPFNVMSRLCVTHPQSQHMENVMTSNLQIDPFYAACLQLVAPASSRRTRQPIYARLPLAPLNAAGAHLTSLYHFIAQANTVTAAIPGIAAATSSRICCAISGGARSGP